MSNAPGQLRIVAAVYVLLLLVSATAPAQSSKAQPPPQRQREAPEVTEVNVRPVKIRFHQPCPANLSFFGTIATNGATTVTYQWIGSGGKTWPKRNLKFAAAGIKSVNQTWRVGTPGAKVNDWVELQILGPNHKTSNRVALDFTCAASLKR